MDIGSPKHHGYVGLEAEAAELSNFEPQLIPGLLQTEAYTRALAKVLPGAKEEDVERQVRVRMLRQERLRHEHPLKMWAIVDEAVLRRAWGGRAVMEEQLEHLLEASAWPNVVLQVLPFDIDGHPAIAGSFAVLSFPEATDLGVAYLDARGGLFLDEAADVAWYRELFDHLRARAAAPERTQTLIRKAAKELT
ncbi:hypothetical protein SAMN05216215_102459 [Saccharopolyspora shandongensis]|uniref:DUF5753 domain-containing protein n=1 Tax=Saccharopolyspora shandongensis TaxID=418495 RepID=A0A1H3IZZ2_9PSEU|nr:DUF5753 domain-containing protein [Saccharopolyspora shandongensis]SDY32484.1 hypothetical protein SAMN05216215_102459 [Saccharopolyspora shandongensis]